MISTILILIACILILAGLLGTIYPALPGLPLMFLGSWLLAYSQDYQVINGYVILAFAVIAIIGTALDFVAGMLGAKYTGASKQAIWGSFIGAIIGAFMGIVGLFLGPLIGAAIGEWIAIRDLLKAGKVGIGSFIGFIIGMVAKLGCALTIVLSIAGLYVWHWIA